MVGIAYTIMNSPLGRLLVARNAEGLTCINFQDGTEAVYPQDRLARAGRQLWQMPPHSWKPISAASCGSSISPWRRRARHSSCRCGRRCETSLTGRQ